MRKRNKKVNIFSRPKNQRKALLKSLVTSLFLHGKITTTQARAKELKSFAEKYITRAMNNTLSNRRVISEVLAPRINKKLFEEIAPNYIGRKGGYTRTIKMGSRKSDGASMAIVELIK
jgi:large subunit ribosomal protein L17